MVMLIFNQNTFTKVPECEKCSCRMLPKDLEIESGIWQCPYCVNELVLEDDTR